MAHFTVTLADQTTDLVQDADAYQQEGPLTTFFAFTGDRRVIDSWSIRLASYRTSDISAIRRTMAPDCAAGPIERQELDSTGPRSDREPVRCRSRSDSVLLAG
jgi:hypothetical protein